MKTAKANVRLFKEADEQQALVSWFRWQYPDQLIFAIPNGGSRNPIEAHNLRLGGVLAGVPDLCIPCPKAPYHGLWLEMKRVDGKLSTVQANMINRLNAKGYLAIIGWGFEDSKAKVKAYMESGKDAR